MASAGSQSERDYKKAKRKYRQHMGLVEKLIEEAKTLKLKEKASERQAVDLKGRLEDVDQSWKEVEDKRDLQLEEVDKDDLGPEEWRNGETHSFDDEIFKKRNIIMQAEETIDQLYGNYDDSLASVRAFESLDVNENTPPALLEDIRTALSNVEVSKKEYASFERQLSAQLVEEWEEDSQCRRCNGILKEDFPEFLNLFQKTTGIDENVKAGIQGAVLGMKSDTKLKYFKCQGTDMNGKYGMWAAQKYQDKTGQWMVDVCYSVYSVKTKLLGLKRKQGSLFSKETVVEDVMTGQKAKGSSNKHMKVGDINGLTENFIVYKALSGFAESGVIPCVRFREDKHRPAALEDKTASDVE